MKRGAVWNHYTKDIDENHLATRRARQRLKTGFSLAQLAT